MSSRKEEIICKVSSIIHSMWYENTKLSEILKETGIGKGQFYHYFSSKRDLGEAVIDYLISNMKEYLFVQVLDQKIPPKAKLNRMLDSIYSTQLDHDGKWGCPIGSERWYNNIYRGRKDNL